MTRKSTWLAGTAAALLLAAPLTIGTALAQSSTYGNPGGNAGQASPGMSNPSQPNTSNPSQSGTMGPSSSHEQTAPSSATSSPSMSSSSAASAIPLSRVTNTDQLASATVQDSSGQQIGQVQKVKTGASGKPTSVEIALNTPSSQGKVVTVRASHLRYDPSARVVVARLSQSQIEAMPSKTSASAPSDNTQSTPQGTGSSY